MSHFTTIATKINDLDCLKTSLQELGYTSGENTTINGYVGDQCSVELGIKIGDEWMIGFNKNNDGIYEVVADWYAVKKNKEKILNKINQKYACNKVIKEARKKGYRVCSVKPGNGETIKIQMRKYA